jgi:hypothetical protein
MAWHPNRAAKELKTMNAEIEHALATDSLIDMTISIANSILPACQAGAIGMRIWWPILSSPFT